MTNGTDKAVLDALQALNEGVRALGEDMRLVRGQIGEMHEDLRDVRLETAKHGMQIDHVDEKLEMLRESIMTALGFTTQVSVQQKKMAKQLSELVERIERLEKSK